MTSSPRTYDRRSPSLHVRNEPFCSFASSDFSSSATLPFRASVLTDIEPANIPHLPHRQHPHPSTAPPLPAASSSAPMLSRISRPYLQAPDLHLPWLPNTRPSSVRRFLLYRAQRHCKLFPPSVPVQPLVCCLVSAPPPPLPFSKMLFFSIPARACCPPCRSSRHRCPSTCSPLLLGVLKYPRTSFPIRIGA